MIRFGVLALLVVGCSPQQKCVSAAMKLAQKAESCGIAVAGPKESSEKRCAEDNEAQLKKRIAIAEHFLAADTCDGLKLRIAEYARQEMAKTVEVTRVAHEAEAAQEKKELQDAFDKAFKAQLEKLKHGEEGK
jgi:hypothetical protein